MHAKLNPKNRESFFLSKFDIFFHIASIKICLHLRLIQVEKSKYSSVNIPSKKIYNFHTCP